MSLAQLQSQLVSDSVTLAMGPDGGNQIRPGMLNNIVLNLYNLVEEMLEPEVEAGAGGWSRKTCLCALLILFALIVGGSLILFFFSGLFSGSENSPGKSSKILPKHQHKIVKLQSML